MNADADDSHSSRKGNKIIDLRAVGEETKQLAAAGAHTTQAQSGGSGDQQTSSTVVSNTSQKSTKKPKQRKSKVQTLQLDHGIHKAFQGDTVATNAGPGKEEHSLEDDEERSTQHEQQMEQDAENKAQADLRKWYSSKR